MSPRIEIDQECMYCKLEQFYSPRKGTVTVTYTCHHPENEGCVCLIYPSGEGVCIYRDEGEEEEEKEEENK